MKATCSPTRHCQQQSDVWIWIAVRRSAVCLLARAHPGARRMVDEGGITFVDLQATSIWVQGFVDGRAKRGQPPSPAEQRKYKPESTVWKLISPLERRGELWFSVAIAKFLECTVVIHFVTQDSVLIKVKLVLSAPVILLTRYRWWE